MLEQLTWFISRASGLSALLAIIILTALGLASAAGLWKAIGRPRWRAKATAFHKPLAWAAAFMVLVHIGALFFDSFVKATWWQILIPFQYPQMPVWVGLGQVALVIAFGVFLSFYFRRGLGKSWRSIHSLGALVCALIIAHAFGAGTDLASGLSVKLLIGLSGTLLLLLAGRYTSRALRARQAAHRPKAEAAS